MMHLTELLQRLARGNHAAMNDVIPLVYPELKRLARAHLRREATRGILQTTALVHESFLKLARNRHPP
jgi:DNA-directed RNA polymerase specialized sigma24 family protein